MKTLIQIGSGLIQPKELRDVFLDICEKIGDLVKRTNLNPQEIHSLFDAIIVGFAELKSFPSSSHSKLVKNWTAFVSVVRDILCYIYKKYPNF